MRPSARAGTPSTAYNCTSRLGARALSRILSILPPFWNLSSSLGSRNRSAPLLVLVLAK